MQKILILDFGSQYTQLIARRIRELNIYCEIIPYWKFKVVEGEVQGVIFSGSPFSVHDQRPPEIPFQDIMGKVPVLGVCYGAQLIANGLGGTVSRSEKREYGRAHLHLVIERDALFQGVKDQSQVWMSHADTITKVPDSFQVIANTSNIEVAAFKKDLGGKEVYGVQFHPEVVHSEEGSKILFNFCVGICGCRQDFTPSSFVEDAVKHITATVGNDQVILALSGGVDSTVAAALLHKAIGNRLHCVFVNNGVLRKNEFQKVLAAYEQMGLNIKGVDAGEAFLAALKGVTDPEKKRKAIGEMFIRLFEAEALKMDDIRWLAQGTIYPDVIESVSVHGPSQTIKSHHNVGGLPEKMHLKIIEPLRLLFKDEVRRVGTSLKLPAEILGRHPFPGPGLAIRILGEVTAEKVKLLQDADDIFINALRQDHLYDKVWQAGAILLDSRAVGVMGDERTYENVVALRAVESTDGMTADWSHLPYSFLARVSSDIINQVRGINRVVYDISSKPPATIEWE